jgi:hypothetical protein
VGSPQESLAQRGVDGGRRRERVIFNASEIAAPCSLHAHKSRNDALEHVRRRVHGAQTQSDAKNLGLLSDHTSSMTHSIASNPSQSSPSVQSHASIMQQHANNDSSSCIASLSSNSALARTLVNEAKFPLLAGNTPRDSRPPGVSSTLAHAACFALANLDHPPSEDA